MLFKGQSVGKIDWHPVTQMHKHPCTPFNRRSNVYDREKAFTIIRTFNEIIFLFLSRWKDNIKTDLKEWNGKVQTGFIRLRLGISGGVL
jgi:hypothetical protein